MGMRIHTPSVGRGVGNRLRVASRLGLLALVAGIGCGDSEAGSLPPPGPLRIVASIPPLADLATQLAAPDATVTSLLPPGASPHAFGLTPLAVRQLETADLILEVGLPSLPFESGVVGNPSTGAKRLALVPAGVTVPDQHPWLSPSMVRDFAGRVSLALVESDPPRAELYRERLGTLSAAIDDLEAELAALSNRADRGTRFLVYHPAWSGFAEFLGLREIAVEQHGKDVTPTDLVALIQELRPAGFQTLFVSPGGSDRGADALARELDLVLVDLDPLPEDWFGGLRRAAEALIREAR